MLLTSPYMFQSSVTSSQNGQTFPMSQLRLQILLHPFWWGPLEYSKKHWWTHPTHKHLSAKRVRILSSIMSCLLNHERLIPMELYPRIYHSIRKYVIISSNLALDVKHLSHCHNGSPINLLRSRLFCAKRLGERARLLTSKNIQSRVSCTANCAKSLLTVLKLNCYIFGNLDWYTIFILWHGVKPKNPCHKLIEYKVLNFNWRLYYWSWIHVETPPQ